MKQLQSLYSVFTFERLRVKSLSDIGGWFVFKRQDKTGQKQAKHGDKNRTVSSMNQRSTTSRVF